jgi:hypothetical protein
MDNQWGKLKSQLVKPQLAGIPQTQAKVIPDKIFFILKAFEAKYLQGNYVKVEFSGS